MDFADALQNLKSGSKVTRSGWNGKGMWIHIQRPDEHSKMQRPYIYIKTAQGQLVPWCPSHSDILENDWEVVHE